MHLSLSDTNGTNPRRRDMWLGVELRHLAALTAIAEERSFRGAADRLGYVQSAISQQIAQLERVVGTRLVDRERYRRGVSLTPTGHVLVRHAERILDRFSAAHADVRAVAASRAHTVTIGVDHISAREVMPRLVTRLAVERSGVDIKATEIGGDEQRLELLERGLLDAAFFELPAPGPFEACEALSDAWVLLVDSDHPMRALDRPVTLGDITGLPLIAGPVSGDRPPLARGGSPDLPWSLVQALVADRHGAAIVPSLAVEREDPGVAVIELGELLPPRVLGLCWPRDRELIDAVEAVCDALRRCGAEAPLQLRAAA